MATAKDFRVEKRRPCVWCGRKSPKVFCPTDPARECGRLDCEQARADATRDLLPGIPAMRLPMTQAQAAAVQRLVRAALELPPPTAEEAPQVEWFEGLGKKA